MKTWREHQRESFTKLIDLVEYLELDDDKIAQIDFSPRFALMLPLRIAAKIPKNCIENPLAWQFLPRKLEKEDLLGFLIDPLMEEESFRVAPSALHKYTGRVLLLTSGACAMHCRYCFRQNFSYDCQDKHFEKELAYIQSDPTIHEVILSGGDPLSLSDELLDNLLHALDQIKHVKLIRFHTRFPIGIPERISYEFLNMLKQIQTQLTFVVHINCAQELDYEIIYALKQVAKLGVPILSQSVLTKGVNDTAESLKNLLLSCATNGIIPYYLHQLDRVRGAAHFEVEETEGLKLIDEVRKCVPGYAMPTYVREVAHQKSKTPLPILS